MITISQKIKRFICWENTLILCMLIISVCIGALILVVGYHHSNIWFIEKKQELELSRSINNEVFNIIDLTSKLKIELDEREKKELESMQIKSKYSAEEINKQQKSLVKYQTKVANSICPIGSWVKLISNTEYGEIYTPVKVTGHYGYQAETYEGICFMTIETDTWRFIDQHEYDLLKRVR